MSAYKDYDDKQLLSLLKEHGDHLAYTVIFDRYSALLYSHAYNKLRNQFEAEDIVQEVFTKFWIKRYELDPNSSFPAFLFVLVRNQIIDLIRRKRVAADFSEAHAEVLVNHEAPTDYLTRERQFNAMIELEIAALTPRMREVFELRRNKNLSIKEIAMEMGIKESTASDQMKKALKILREKLKWATLFTLMAILAFSGR